MEQTGTYFGFSAPALPCLVSMLPEYLQDEKVKCRIEYREEILNIDFTVYTPKIISSLMLVEVDNIDYSFKFSDRTGLNSLNDKKGECDEVLVVQNGCITDTTYSNVVFRRNNEFFTPETFLLNGTKRQKLLRESIIQKIRITADNLMEFDCVYLINSMLDIEDRVGCPVKNVFSV